MANVSNKPTPNISDENAIRQSFNVEDKSITVSGFLVGKVGHKIQVSYPAANTEKYEYFDEATLLYTILVTYTDGTKANVQTIERTT